MAVLIFAPRFVEAVERGFKRQTIRPPRKRPVRPGDPLSLRAWSGRPYRSPQRALAVAVCSAVEPVTLWERRGRLRVEVAGLCLSPMEVWAFALADGFTGAPDMLEWYRAERTTPFEGTLIRWEYPG